MASGDGVSQEVGRPPLPNSDGRVTPKLGVKSTAEGILNVTEGDDFLFFLSTFGVKSAVSAESA